MKLLRTRLVGLGREARGFTLPEVMITIAIMGILAAIAIPSWFGVIESRQVDSAANQVASDLRLAHTRATNQLADFEVAFTDGSPSYTLEKLTPPGGTVTRTLPDGTQAGTNISIKFKADGSAEVTDGVGNTVRVVSSNDAGKHHDIQFNVVTSRVEIVS